MKNLVTAIAILVVPLFFGCDNVDLSSPDNYPVEATLYTGADGVEHVGYKQLPFDYDLYAQSQEALSGAPPDRFGLDSVAPVTATDTRCPSGGYTSGSNFCWVPGSKHINWDMTAIDNRFDAQAGINVRTYLIQGLAVAAQDAAPTGFVHEKENSLRTLNGIIRFEECPAPADLSYACTTWNAGPVVLAGGQRVRLSTGTGFLLRIGQRLASDISGMTGSQKAFEIQNVIGHELHHADGNGHVPSAENQDDPMNLVNGRTNVVVKHLSASEKSRMTSWYATF